MHEITLGRVSDTRAATQPVRYQERLRVPWWWFPPGFLLAGLIALELNQAVKAMPDWVPFAVLFPVAVAVLMWFGRIDVRVVGGDRNETELWVGWRAPAGRRHLTFGRGATHGEVGGAGPPAGSGGLRGAQGLDRARWSWWSSTTRTTPPPTGSSVADGPTGYSLRCEAETAGAQAAQSVQIIMPFFSLASRLR